MFQTISNAVRPKKFERGFTLIEILVVIGMIAILAAVVLVAINPLHQFAQARNSQRISNVNAILNAIGNRMAENKGVFEDSQTCDVTIPEEAKNMSSVGANLDIRPCLVPTYISELPFDPSRGDNSCTTEDCGSGEYDTNYTVALSPDTHRITVCAPSAVDDGMDAPYCLTR